MDYLPPQQKKGAPTWMATFADLATLLMCFFVLLLSFSEMDVLKFQQIAGSMKNAFGVQNVLNVNDIPKGTSIIAQEFRPGRPEPTPIEVIMQQTIDMTKRSLDFHDGMDERDAGSRKDSLTLDGGNQDNTGRDQRQQQAQTASQIEKILAQALAREISDNTVEVESFGQQLVIRIKEKGAFPEGSAFLQPKFIPLIQQVTELVKDVPGIIRISGHTDNQALDSELYRSKWDISSQRAVSVAQVMEQVKGFDRKRMRVVGMADTTPIADNKTAQGRSRNRRVEISIVQGRPYYSEAVSAEKK
ncbi:flagellar motor protein MotB [Photobacterium iliopiscarium]|uniref:flagellar motor protein MotB n=1 Tax=Photobacterium iliopiscarium TaxID=56192 RepID=UPI001E4FC911|nr:flagellar motor protein MotB [Photobacterium iliopiscarium]MCD9468404.1 flagellar motor protein MotB [Photobacterium iliopiscarium]MCD9488367.1 OmpA family protein [Photobacterium iliopiscarium]MCF2245130.1 OmpA family protein [Photobacterium iliopiscarium]